MTSLFNAILRSKKLFGKTDVGIELDCSGQSIEKIDWWVPPYAVSAKVAQITGSENRRLLKSLHRQLAQGELPLFEIDHDIEAIHKELASEDFSYSRLNLLLEHTPALRVELLQLANSASFNSSGIALLQLQHALPRLGQQLIRSQVYYHVLKHARPQHSCYSAIAEELLQHSVATAHIAHSLAAYCNLSAGLVYEAALLLNVGKLLLLDFLDKHFDLPQDFESSQLGEANLSDLFESCHVELIGHQLAHWHMNALLSFIVRNQQSTLPKDKAASNEWQLIALLKFSSDCARVLAKGAPLPGNHAGLLKTPESQLLGLLDSSATCRQYLLRLPKLV